LATEYVTHFSCLMIGNENLLLFIETGVLGVRSVSFIRKNPTLGRLWVSRFFNANGSGIGQFAIKWMATAFPHPAVALAYTNTLGSLSQVVCNYMMGWLSDNSSPYVLMMFGNIFGALFAVAIGLLLQRYHVLFLLCILVVLWAAFSVTSNAASAKLIPQLTEPKNLPNVNSWMGTIPPLQQFLSNGLAGILIASGIMHAFWVAAIAMALAAVSMMTKRKRTSHEHQVRKSRNITTGIRTVMTDPILLRMVIFVSLLNFGYSFYLGEYLLYLRNAEHLSAISIGLGLTIATVGTALSLIIGPIVLKRRIAMTVIVTPAIMSIGIAVVFLWSGFIGFIVGFTLVELGSGISGQYVSLIRQRTVPMEKMGSVAGALWMFQTILVPLGMILAGVVAVHWGVQMTLYMSCVFILISVLPSFSLAGSLRARFN